MWLQRKVPGVTATHVLAGPGGTALAGRIAEVARKLHQAGVPPRRRHTIADELRILHERLPLVAAVYPQWAARLDRVLAACDALGMSLPQPVPCGIHRDFYADNVIVDVPPPAGEAPSVDPGKARLYLIDLDLYAEGDPGLDLGNIIAHVTEQSLRTLADAAALAGREMALERRFVELAGEAVRPSIHAYTTLTLVRHISLSTQFPERRHTTERLLGLCERRLNLPG
jgi:aminoglycoside phosphotransferase (APT) family kinase protein